MNRKKEIIKMINQISGKYSAYEVFTDWVKCLALAISNSCNLFHDSVWEERERMYMDTISKYTPEEQQKLIKMSVMLFETFESCFSDILGEIYMEAGMGSKSAGQFFTPFHLSKLCASLTPLEMDERGKIRVNEPSCGGGGMIIAAAAALNEKGINYQNILEVVAQDLDWKGVYMCYVQLSLLGISAVCVQGNTLSEPYDPKRTPKSRILITPKKAGMFI